MRLLRVHILKADTCGGLLDGLDVRLRNKFDSPTTFDPLCLIGPNGAGKSQFLQIIAEIFQSIFHAAASAEERIEGNPKLQFELEYLIRPAKAKADVHVRISRKPDEKQKTRLLIEKKKTEGDWEECAFPSKEASALLPRKVVGYTSGDNETLSLPFLLSRSGYADEVYSQATKPEQISRYIPDTRLMLIDYGTHLEVLVSNLILSSEAQGKALVSDARLKGLHSFRCVVQLAHPAVPKVPSHFKNRSPRKGIQLTPELETYLDQLKRCATCHHFEEKTEKYTFDFFVDGETVKAFSAFWTAALDLYSALHKLAMLNDLAIPKPTRERFRKETEKRRFASRLPEPQDEDKVFRFERVNFRADGKKGQIVDYVSLSDGEHQLAQLLGTFSMLSYSDVLFLLDEPESHFNPQWRVKFISRLLDLPTANGIRREATQASQQDALLTTHAPFVPSDMPRDNVLIFGKEKERIAVKRPDIETFGSTFDAILDVCFDVRPPLSQESRTKIDELKNSDDANEIRQGIEQLGHSVEKAFLADRLRQLPKEESK
jgi:restriction system-associated AAA family ATPase